MTADDFSDHQHFVIDAQPSFASPWLHAADSLHTWRLVITQEDSLAIGRMKLGVCVRCQVTVTVRYRAGVRLPRHHKVFKVLDEIVSMSAMPDWSVTCVGSTSGS